MTSLQIYVPIVATLVFIAINVELIRRERLNERFATFWIVVNLLMLFVALNTNMLYKIAALFESHNIASLLYSLAIFFILLLGVFFSVDMSSHVKQIKNLNQDIAILRRKIEDLEKRAG